MTVQKKSQLGALSVLVQREMEFCLQKISYCHLKSYTRDDSPWGLCPHTPGVYEA